MNAILFDLDGVIYQADQPIEGAADVIRWCRDQAIPHLFLTNTSSRPRSALVQKLEHFNIETDESRIFTPPVAATYWLIDHVQGKVALFVPEATRQEFASLDWLEETAESGAAAVVVGDLGLDWDFTTLNRAFRLLISNPQTRLVALGMTRYWCASDGLRLDAGAFVSALEYASGTCPVVMGKPALTFFETAAEMLGESPADCVMVGDDIRSDVQGAQEAGLRGVLVRTGKFAPGDLKLVITPDAVLDSVVDLPEWWKKNLLT
ncbi:MAG: TIGR01458 family HAD-type hydrolase [Pseudomonadota bacterium]